MKKPDERFRWADQQLMAAGAAGAAAVYFFFSASYSLKESSGLLILDLTIGIAWTILAIRAFRAGVIARERGLEVRNLFRTIYVPWPNLIRFELGALRLVRRPVAVARLRDGSSVPLGTFTAPFRTSIAIRRIQKMIDRLNSEREKRVQGQE